MKKVKNEGDQEGGGKVIQMPILKRDEAAVEPDPGELVLGETIEQDVTNTETLEQRKNRTLIIMAKDGKMIADSVKLVGEKYGAFTIIADEEIFEEFFARFISDSSAPLMEQTVDNFFTDPKNIEKASELSVEIGNAMGFDKEFRIYKLTNSFPWKLEECQEKMNMLVKFGLAVQGKSDTSGVPSQYFTIIQDKEKRKLDIFNTIDGILNYAYDKMNDVRNILSKEEKKEFEEKLKKRIAKRFGFDLEGFTNIIDEIEKTQKENGDCSFLNAMIMIQKKEEAENKTKKEAPKEIAKEI